MQGDIAAGPDSEDAWLLLAAAREAAQDSAGEEAALNGLLEVEPHSVRGQIRKGDCRAHAGDTDLACFFYRRALRDAAGRRLSEEIAAEVQRARQALAGIEHGLDSARQARLAARGLPADDWSPRFRHALDIAAGRKKLYLQEPTAYAYPELPHRQFYEPSEFSWAPAVEAAAAAIRAELIALLETEQDEFRPYVQNDIGTVPLGESKTLLNKKDWSVLALCTNGWAVPEIVQRCPKTWEAVLATPLPRVSGWGPTVVFSMLKAGAHIAPHTGMFNTRLICHLPLIVPPGCRFRVGNEVREWQEGKLLIFDDTIEHEAWNDGSEDRIVLIFDIWRPELTERERHELTALFSD